MSEYLETEDRDENLVSPIQDDVEGDQTRSMRAPRDSSASYRDQRKKKKTRRGKPKRRCTNPYVKLSWQQRKNQDDIQTKKANKVRAKMIAHGQTLAPYNTTQFLIEDHGYLKDIEDRLNNSDPCNNDKNDGSVPPRTRDSSFSVDSDVDFYSSPEDEEEFLTKEFSNTYQDIRSERLNAMSREELMQECIQMENKLDILTKRLNGKVNIDGSQTGYVLNVTTVEEFKFELMKLMTENESLRRENEHLRQRGRRRKTDSVSSTMSSSMDSESDSSSSDSNSDSDTQMVENGISSSKSSPQRDNEDSVLVKTTATVS